MGVFTRNLGLVSGVISGLCYAWIAASAALLAWLPERSQAPMGWFYLVAAAGLLALWWTARGRLEPEKASDPVGPPSPR